MIEPLPYIPHTIIRPGRVLDGYYGTSSWIGLESVLADLLDHFQVRRDTALEFGVEHGYSTVALSNFFDVVMGVDPFGQQTASDPIEPMEQRARRNCQPYANISIITMPWQTFTKEWFERKYDLIHVDGEHGYYDTFGAGDWACAHAPVVLFHDTLSFSGTVMPACRDLAARHGYTFYNYTGHVHGLGILVDGDHKR